MKVMMSTNEAANDVLSGDYMHSRENIQKNCNSLRTKVVVHASPL